MAGERAWKVLVQQVHSSRHATSRLRRAQPVEWLGVRRHGMKLVDDEPARRVGGRTYDLRGVLGRGYCLG